MNTYLRCITAFSLNDEEEQGTSKEINTVSKIFRTNQLSNDPTGSPEAAVPYRTTDFFVAGAQVSPIHWASTTAHSGTGTLTN